MSSEEILPNITDTDEPFWIAAGDHELRMQKCTECNYIRWPPGQICPECWSGSAAWTELNGTGEIRTWVVFHRSYFDAFADEIPYNVAEIELSEGPRYLANVVDVDNDDLYQGMPVEVVFDDVTDEITLPKFQPQDR